MATKKDLVEAYAFSRRRLVTAFLSGAPGGREVEPSRPGRTVVGGLALAVLLVAGAAIASVLASRTEEDWNRVGLVVSRQVAAPYVILEDSADPQLIPVINITSAQLILGADLDPTYVDQDVIEDQTPGEPIGIAGAPQVLPRPEQFIETGWTACTADDAGTAVDMSADPLVTVPEDGGVVVRSEDGYWVIGRSGELDPADERRAYRYALPDSEQGDALLADLGLDSKVEAPTVPLEWLDLFPEGGELSLASFGVEGFGQRLTGQPDLPDGARVGDYIVDEDGEGGVFLTADGTTSTLSAFALAVYAHSPVPGDPTSTPRELDVPVPQVDSAGRAFEAAHWPDGGLQPVRGQLCARLDARHAEVPLVDLAADPRGSAAVDETLPAGEKTVSIDQGRGAFVRAGTWEQTTSGSAWVVDPRGQAYSLLGADTIAKLAYDRVEESFVPDQWLELFRTGVALSTSRALCPPDVPDEVGGDDEGSVGSSSSAPSAARSASASAAPLAEGCQEPPP